MGGNSPDSLLGISIIVITLNEEANIGLCLNTLTAQRYPADRFEIIVVDASSDRTAEIVAGYPGVRVIRSEKGFARQKNAGWHAARFDLLAFTDADCLVPDKWLRAVADTMAETHVHAIGGDAFPPPGTGWLGRCIAAVGHPAGGSLGFDANVTGGPNGIEFIAGCNSVFDKEALVQVNGFDDAFQQGGEDVDLSRRLRKAGYTLYYSPDIFLYHKPHEPLGTYFLWNIGVGLTRWSLHRPGLLRIIFYPWFPVWPMIVFAGWVFLTAWFWPLGILAAIVAWLKWLAILWLFSRPYQFLWKRRKQTGVGRLSALTMVPFLILVRQIAMSIGEFRKWRLERGK